MPTLRFRAWWKPYEGTPKMIYFDGIGYCDEYNHLSISLSKKSRNPNGGDYSNLCADIDQFSPIMQSTGLKDKNGVEIFEGDRVRWVAPNDSPFLFDSEMNGKIGDIRFNKRSAQFGADFHGPQPGLYTMQYNDRFEVIGHLHQEK